MSDEEKYTLEEAQLEFAKRLNGRVWELLAKEDRTPEESEEMAYAAHASHYHWLQVGTGVNQQRGEWLIARVFTVLGLADAALHHAGRCLELTEQYRDKMEDFDLAFAYEGYARANALAGEAEVAKEFIQKAGDAGEAIKNEGDKKYFVGDFDRGDWYGMK